MAPGEGEQPPGVYPAPPSPLGAAAFTSSSTRAAASLPQRGRGSPRLGGWAGGARAQEGLSDPALPARAFCLLIRQWETKSTSQKRELPNISQLLLINHQHFLAADRSPPPSGPPLPCARGIGTMRDPTSGRLPSALGNSPAQRQRLVGEGAGAGSSRACMSLCPPHPPRPPGR